MKIIITAGGNSERIDDVRSITNSSSGRLGYAIGQSFLDTTVETVYYLHGLRAQPLENPKVKAIPISGVLNLAAKMEELLTSEKIDVVIHAMAVSDYTVKEVTTVENLRNGNTKNPQEKNMLNPCQAGKINSNLDDVAILLKRAPKVISTIKELSPNTTLVGFKLLSHVPHKELIQAGYSLLEKSRCNFVLANDLNEISTDQHRGYLIHKDGTYDTMENKEEIASMIVKRVMEECK